MENKRSKTGLQDSKLEEDSEFSREGEESEDEKLNSELDFSSKIDKKGADLSDVATRNLDEPQIIISPSWEPSSLEKPKMKKTVSKSPRGGSHKINNAEASSILYAEGTEDFNGNFAQLPKKLIKVKSKQRTSIQKNSKVS